MELLGEPEGGAVSVWDTTAEADGVHCLSTQDVSVAVCVMNTSAVVHGGRLAASETWSSDQIHVVRSNIVVPDGITLTIGLDAIVKFAPGAKIATEGTGGLIVNGTRCADVADSSVGGDLTMDDLSGEQIGDSEERTTLVDWFAEDVMPVSVNINYWEWDGAGESFFRYYTVGATLGNLPKPAITESPLWEYRGWIVGGTSDSPEYVTSSTVVNGGMEITTYYEEIVYHSVTFDLGDYGAQTGGGELVQSVKEGELAVAPEFDVQDGWLFTGWDNDITAAIYGDTTFTAVLERIPITVGEAANAPDFDWYTEGDADWFGEWSKAASDGVHAARSGAIGNSQETVLGLRLDGAGTLSFDWRASCEEKYDAVRLEVDGSLVRGSCSAWRCHVKSPMTGSTSWSTERLWR